MTVGFTSAFNASSLSNVTSSSGHTGSTTLPWRNSNFVSKENATAPGTIVEPSSQHDSRIPATNSNGDYVTTIVDSYTDSEMYTSRFTLNGALTSSPATYIKTETYTVVTAAHYGPVKSVKSVNFSTTAEIWDRNRIIGCGFQGFPLGPSGLHGFPLRPTGLHESPLRPSGLHESPLRPSLCNTAWPSFTNYGREPACTAAYSSFLATGPLKTRILTSVTSSTLPNGQATVGIVYSTDVLAPGLPCCGNCTLIFQSLQMLYWPGSHPQTSCLTTSRSIANNDLAWSTPSSGHQQGDNRTNDQPLYATGVNGHVLSVPERAPILLIVAYSGDT